LILIESGPNSTKDCYDNLIDYDHNPIDTLFISHLVEPKVPEEALGPVFPNPTNMMPYYSLVFSGEEPMLDKETGSYWLY